MEIENKKVEVTKTTGTIFSISSEEVEEAMIQEIRAKMNLRCTDVVRLSEQSISMFKGYDVTITRKETGPQE